MHFASWHFQLGMSIFKILFSCFILEGVSRARSGYIIRRSGYIQRRLTRPLLLLRHVLAVAALCKHCIQLGVHKLPCTHRQQTNQTIPNKQNQSAVQSAAHLFLPLTLRMCASTPSDPSSTPMPHTHGFLEARDKARRKERVGVGRRLRRADGNMVGCRE